MEEKTKDSSQSPPSVPHAFSSATALDQAQQVALYDLMKIILQDPKLDYHHKKKLIDELRKNNSAESDRWTYRSVIWILGAAVLLTIIFIYALAVYGLEIPDSLIAIGSTVAGGIAGLLAPRDKSTTPSEGKNGS